jgi:hypothetical protein
MKMGTKRIVVVGIVTLIVTLLALTVPPRTVVSLLGLDLTIVVLFRVVAPLLFVGFLLEVISNWGRRLIPGRWGERVADSAQGLSPVFLYMVPAEIAYIVLFVAFAVNVPFGWIIFQVLFPPGLFLLPFAFFWRGVWASIKDAYGLLTALYLALYSRIEPIKFRSRVIRPNRPATSWKSAIVHSIRWVWLAVALFYAVLIVQQLAQSKNVDSNSVFSVVVQLVAIVVVTAVVFYAVQRYPPPIRPPSP